MWCHCYGDDIVLISNGKKSYDYETGNYADNYKLTSDSEFRFADENGVYKVLKIKMITEIKSMIL